MGSDVISINADVYEQDVMLTGVVETEDQRDTAEAIVGTVEGVKKIHNMIMVQSALDEEKGAVENFLDDSVIETKINEGIFFSYTPSQSPCGNLIELLGRRDIVIRELLKHRRPYLTDLSVLVADLQDSVKICAELPPEEYFELFNQIWSTMDPILRKYHATHGKHVGDELLCYFFPQPDSQYIMNSIHCALEMEEAMQKINQEWRSRKNWTNNLMLNIGIDEGQEWFGAIQTNTHLEFTVLGDTVNRGGRLSDFARGGTIWGTKNLIGKLNHRDREKVGYGINRHNADDQTIFVKTTFSRISNLVDLELAENQKYQDLGSLPVTEIVYVS